MPNREDELATGLLQGQKTHGTTTTDGLYAMGLRVGGTSP